MPQEGSGLLFMRPIDCTPWCSTDAGVDVARVLHHMPSYYTAHTIELGMVSARVGEWMVVVSVGDDDRGDGGSAGVTVGMSYHTPRRNI